MTHTVLFLTQAHIKEASLLATNRLLQNDRHITNADDYYDTVGACGANDIDLDNDPGYEVIQKKTISTNRTQPPISNSLVNGIRAELSSDPGYEAIGYDESDFDPNYEVITKKVMSNRQPAEIVEPSYEVIKRAPQMHSISTRLEVSRNVSDVSSEPGYERIRFTQKSITIEQTDSEPNYAFISRRDGSHKSNDDDDQIMSERL